MLYALNKQDEKILAKPSARAICACCGGEVIAKCGQIKIWHWAHKSKAVDCNFEPETDWHLNWKSYAAPERTEVKIVKDGVYKMADILLSNGMVVEVQHSPISVDEIQLRESFYGKMLWIFDCREAFKKNRLYFYSDKSRNGEYRKTKVDWRRRCGDNKWYHKMYWNWAKMSIVEHCNEPIYLDLGDDMFKVDKWHYCPYDSGIALYGKRQPKQTMIDYISDLGRMDYQQYEKYNYEM